ncbi:MAG: globin domain-containing protein [Tepidisphaeraceae bacterium]
MKFTTHPLSGEKIARRDFPNAPADRELAARLRTSLAGILAQRDALADRFYMRLFDLYPGVRPLFKTDMTAQKGKLTKTLQWVVENLDRPESVRVAAREMGVRHEAYGAKPEHYPVICDLLVDTMAQLAGSAWNDDVAADWKQALKLLSELMLGDAAAQAFPATRKRTRPT